MQRYFAKAKYIWSSEKKPLKFYFYFVLVQLLIIHYIITAVQTQSAALFWDFWMCFFIPFWALLCHCQNSYWEDILWPVWQRMWCHRDEQRMGQLQDNPSSPLWTALPLPSLLGELQGSATAQSAAARLGVALILCWIPSRTFILVRMLLMQLSLARSDLARSLYRKLWK